MGFYFLLLFFYIMIGFYFNLMYELFFVMHM